MSMTSFPEKIIPTPQYCLRDQKIHLAYASALFFIRHIAHSQ